jgi:hypothetical protein
VTYDSNDEMFVVHREHADKPNMEFKMHKSGLHYFNPKDADFTFNMNTVLDEHENSNKENPRNREPGCIYTIEYVNSESSSLFFYNPSRETVVYCQSRLRYCYKATVRRSNEQGRSKL